MTEPTARDVLAEALRETSDDSLNPDWWPLIADQVLPRLTARGYVLSSQPEAAGEAGLRAAAERYHVVMDTVIESISEVRPEAIGAKTSAGFYILRKWVVEGLAAAEGNFRAAPALPEPGERT